jgi:5'-nucleotidase
VADIFLQAYAEMLEEKKVHFEKDKDEDGIPDVPQDRRQADCALICGGTLRGDSQYGPGK